MSAATGEPPPGDAICAAYYHLIRRTPGVEHDLDVLDAAEIYGTPYHHVLDALLLIKTEDAALMDGLGLSATTLAAYKHLFFDSGVFRHVFAARNYVNTIHCDGSEEFKSYDLAITEGAEALLSRYRLGEAAPMDPLSVTASMLREFAMRAREHRGQSLNSRIAQNALKAARGAVDTAVALRNMQPKNGGQNAAQLLEFALKNEPNTLPAEQSPVPLLEIIRTGPVVKPVG